MNKILILVFIVVAPATTIAQRSKMTLAEKFYQSFDYRTAGNIYRDVLSNAKYANDTIALSRIADCERKTGNLIAAEGYYKQLIKLKAASRNDLRALAEIFKFQGKYEEAITTYKLILEKYPDDDIAKNYVDNPNFAIKILRDSAIYTIRNSNINSSSSDFAPGFFTSNKVIFSSSRAIENKDERIYTRTQQPYLNVYLSDISPDSSLNGAIQLANKVNSRYHEGTLAYDPGRNTMYLTRNNYVRGTVQKAKDGKTNLGIYTTEYNATEGTWGDLEKFTFNNKEYNVGNPTLNISSNKLYFVSDMPGGHGGTDIYVSERKGDTWSDPQNLGNKINTSGDEMFPYMVGDSTLYFSSTGHLGLGGLDVFYTNPYDEKPVRNIGYPANSHYDDFSLICYSDEIFGYFGSNRAGGKGDDDIYQFKIKPVDSLIVSGLVVDSETLKPIPNAIVSVPTDDGSQIQVKTDANGNYIIKAPYKKEVIIEGNKEGYRTGQAKGKPDPRSAYLEKMDIKMQKIDYMVSGKVYYEDNNAPAIGALVRLYEITSNDTIMIDSVVISSTGTYSFYLWNSRKYLLEATKQDYARQTHAFATNDPVNKVHTHDFKLFKAKVGEVVRLDNIYYDYKKWDIRPDAAKELNKLVQILIDNPTMKIELGSHSDARGSDAYNLDLSDKRAKSAATYIVSQGIAAERLYGKGYGESLILNHCKNDVKCTEDEHQYNRRTEFKITAF